MYFLAVVGANRDNLNDLDKLSLSLCVSFIYHVYEPVEQVVAVLRAWARFRVVLD